MKKTLSLILSLIMVMGILLSAPISISAADDEIPTLAEGPEIKMIALADRDYTYVTAYYENTIDAMELYKDMRKYPDNTEYLVDNFGFSDGEYDYHSIYIYVQTAYSLNGGTSWVNDFERDENLSEYNSGNNVEISEYDVYLPTQSANLYSVYQYDTLFSLDFYDWNNSQKDAVDDAVDYITQGKGTYIGDVWNNHQYEVNLTAANSLIAKARYVIVVNGNKAGEEDDRKFIGYSDWGNTFSFSTATSPESENFIKSGSFDAPVIEFARKSGSYYRISIIPGEELSNAITENRVLYQLGLSDDYYDNYESDYIRWYFELKINDGEWFHYRTSSAEDLEWDDIHDSYLVDDLEYYYGITIQPEDRIYLRTRMMTEYQVQREYLDNTEESDGRYIYVPEDVMTLSSAYSEPIEIPFSGRYSITYRLNGGDWPNYNSKIYDFGEDDTGIIDLTSEDYVPEKYGYTFGGWYTTEDFQEGTEITEINLDVKQFTTVYAKWETEGEYDIKYELGISGAYNYNKTMYTPLMDDITLNDASYSGVNFAGWYETEDFSGEPVTVIDTARKENITLYAKWDFPTFNITYELDGGTNHANNPATFQVNPEGVNVILQAPTKTGYIFDGWYYYDDFTGSLSKYDDGWHFNRTEDTTIYAKWIIGRWDINYTFILDGTVNEDFHPYNNNPSEYTYGDTVTLKNLSATGYTFGGWFTDEACTVPATGVSATDEGKKTFYGKWNEIVLTITYVYDSDKANSPDVSTVTNENPTKRKYSETVELKEASSSDPAYIFKGWHTDVNLASDVAERVSGSSNVTLYAKWEHPEYTITYSLDGGTNSASNPSKFLLTSSAGEDITIQAPSKADHIFEGWFYDTAFTKPLTKDADGWHIKADSNITVYAKYILGKWNISYVHMVDGVETKDFYVNNTNPSEYTYGKTVKLDPLSTAGYEYDGIYTDKECSLRADKITATDTGNKVFYVKWTENTYVINYVLTDGNSDMPDAATITHENPSERKYSQTVTLKDAVTTDDAYVFAGWYSDKDMTLRTTTVSAANDVTLYAKWEKVYIPHWGDVTLSSGTNAADARLVLRYSAKLENDFTDTQKRLADINNDGKINAADARLVLRMSAKLETEENLIQKYSLPKIEVKNGEIVFT